jgi:hypothetical protein
MTKTDQTPETPDVATELPPVADATPDTADGDVVPEVPPADPETFPREYVEKLRDENAKYRQRAGQTDQLAQRLHLELVKATGRLADPTDLPYDADHISDPANMVTAIDDLLATKPHLANRKPTGTIGQGASVVADNVSLSGLLRSNAR